MKKTKNCVACNKGIFVRKIVFIVCVEEIQKHLCPKHLKEYKDKRVAEIKVYLEK